MKKRKVKCPECKGKKVIDQVIMVGYMSWHHELKRCERCDGKGVIYQ
jgi:DnaJ-class molecular chaperone